MLTCTAQAMLAHDREETEGPRHTVHEDRQRPSDFAVAAATMASALTEQQIADRALSERVRVACRQALITRLQVVRECIASGKASPAFLLTADHLVATVIRDLRGAF